VSAIGTKAGLVQAGTDREIREGESVSNENQLKDCKGGWEMREWERRMREKEESEQSNHYRL